MRFDSNQAWRDAAQSVSANREVLLALAGVFVVLPMFVLAVLLPQPEPEPGATPRAMMAAMSGYYAQAWPWLLLMAALQLVGTLAMLALFTDRSRPTVREALQQALRAVGPVIAAQILVGLAVGICAAVPLALALALHAAPLVALVGAVVLVAIVYLSVRTSLLSAAVIVDGITRPMAALRRSWDLTRGNVGRLLLFYVLLTVAFVVVISVVQAVFGLALVLVSPGEARTLVQALIASVGSAVMVVYMVSVVAAVYRQLAGPSAAAIEDMFG